MEDILVNIIAAFILMVRGLYRYLREKDSLNKIYTLRLYLRNITN